MFTNSKDEWFVLIGQDCDMARSITRTPKNALAELLPAKVRHQTQFDKWANDLRSASIYSFRKTLGSECEVLQVEYQNRQYIANEVLNLCSFNSDGQCRISLSEPLGLHQEQLMPTYMTTYYASELNRVLGLLGLPILSKPDQDVILKDDSTELNLEMGKKAKIVKAKQKVYFEYYSK